MPTGVEATQPSRSFQRVLRRDRSRVVGLVAIVAVVAGGAAAALLAGPLRHSDTPAPRVAGATATPSVGSSASGASPAAGSSGVPIAPVGPCSRGGLANGLYSLSVCISAPADGATVAGAVGVVGSVNVTGKDPGVGQAVFTLDGQPLLTSFTKPFGFRLDTSRFSAGAHTLALTVVMRDGFRIPPAGVHLQFGSGASPQANGAFKPTAGAAVAAGHPLVLAAAGDGASGEPGETSTVGLISGWNPNLFLYLGDVYEAGTPTEFDNYYGPASATGRYGQLRAITDPTVGNHEYLTVNAAGYFGYWSGIPHYYSFDAAGWHFVSLDANAQFDQSPGSPQYRWLQADLSADRSACTVVYWHQPVFNVGPEGSSDRMKPIWSLLAQHHVTLVLNGHDHDYQRWVPLDGAGRPAARGVTEMIVGSGGHGHQTRKGNDPRLAFADFTDFGALRMQLYPTSATFQFVAVGGNVVDSGLVPCANTVDSRPPSSPGAYAAQAAGPGQVALSWSPAADDVGVAGYDVYRDGAPTPIVVLAPDATSYTDTYLAPSSSHTYSVVAFDAAGNHSPPAGPRSVTVSPDPVSVPLAPVADAYVSAAAPDQSYGTADVVRVSAVASTGSMTGYLGFDLTHLNGTIQSAQLRVYVRSGSHSGFGVYGVSATSIPEATLNAGNAPPLPSSPAATSGPVSGGSWVTVDVTSLVQAAAGHGLVLGLGATASQVSVGSRESANPPQLLVTLGP